MMPDVLAAAVERFRSGSVEQISGRSHIMTKQGLSVRGLLLVGAAAVLFGQGRATAQENPAQYITEASQRLAKLVGQASNQGFHFENNKFAIGGGFLDQGADKWINLYNLKLDGGKQYRVIASGDADARDVDVQIVDLSNNQVVASDTGTAPEAVVTFTPKTTGKYLVKVRLYASQGNVPCICLAVVMAK
jgi:hypothetical protein